MTGSDGIKVAVLGAGNVGGTLLYVLESSEILELALVADLDPTAPGLAQARRRGVATSLDGIETIASDPEIALVFDATSAAAHRSHAGRLREADKASIDLTGGTAGPHVVPTVNGEEHLSEGEVGLATCPAQIAVPIVHAIGRLAPLIYAEVATTLAARALGPGTRGSIDEFTAVGGSALERPGGARRGKAITVVSPADPPVVMQSTVYAVAGSPFDVTAASAAAVGAVTELRDRLPGCRLKGEPAHEERQTPWGLHQVLSVNLEVESSGSPLPPYAGSAEAMAVAARSLGEAKARYLMQQESLVA
jgi:acetaldehyde dehydrogenase